MLLSGVACSAGTLTASWSLTRQSSAKVPTATVHQLSAELDPYGAQALDEVPPRVAGPRHPRRYRVITLFEVRNVAADVCHYADALMAEQMRALVLWDLLEFVDLGKADAGRRLLDDHLVRAGVRRLHLVDRHRLIRASHHRRSSL